MAGAGLRHYQRQTFLRLIRIIKPLEESKRSMLKGKGTVLGAGIAAVWVGTAGFEVTISLTGIDPLFFKAGVLALGVKALGSGAFGLKVIGPIPALLEALNGVQFPIPPSAPK